MYVLGVYFLKGSKIYQFVVVKVSTFWGKGKVKSATADL